MPKKIKKKRVTKHKRNYKTDKKSKARRRFRRTRHKRSAVTGHHQRHLEEAEMTNFLLNALLKTAASTDEKPYHYNPRHHTRDPEFKYSGDEMKEFKSGFAAPDTNFWRPQGDDMPPHRGNFPGWRPEWIHTYDHPHAGIV